MLWQGVESCRCSSDVDLRGLTLILGTRFQLAWVYQPSFSMQPTGSYSNASGIRQLTLAVPDHIVVVELLP